MEGWVVAHSYSRKQKTRGGVMTLCRSDMGFSNIVEVNDLSCDFNLAFNCPDGNCKYFCDLLNCYGFRRTIWQPTRAMNCIDNVFVNFSLETYNAETIDFNFSDHRAQLVRVDLPIALQSHSDVIRRFRPLTQKGMNLFHSRLSSTSWDYIHSNDADVNLTFNVFNEYITQTFSDCFPYTEIKSKKKDHGVAWFSRDLTKMRDHLNLLGDMYQYYQDDQLKKAYDNFRKSYRSYYNLINIKVLNEIAKKKKQRRWWMTQIHGNRTS
ncbi:hypothetical protein WA026_022277 [Henosepilachna vigintioctopunctata]|uniref:Uncharacterized protein n=1 Tax=Henosepilachna vigintioctopunctata TaxID=420089 RepID=A0AAW1VIN0_9CUCU